MVREVNCLAVPHKFRKDFESKLGSTVVERDKRVVENEWLNFIVTKVLLEGGQP